jgi:hypothetical protein
MTRVRFRHTTRAGEIEESDLLICAPDEWADRPEKASGEFSGGVVDLTNLLEDFAPGEPITLWFALGPIVS